MSQTLQLLVGGPSDGRRIMIDDRLMVANVPDWPPLGDPMSPYNAPITSQSIPIEQYVRTTLRGERGEHHVFVHKGKSVDWLTRHLIERYRGISE